MTFGSRAYCAKTLFKNVFLLHLLYLSRDVLEDTICAQIVELSKCGMNTLSIAKGHGCRAISLVDTFWFVVKYDLVKLLCVNHNWSGFCVVFIKDTVVEQALFSVDGSSGISALPKFLNQPFQDG